MAMRFGDCAWWNGCSLPLPAECVGGFETALVHVRHELHFEFAVAADGKAPTSVLKWKLPIQIYKRHAGDGGDGSAGAGAHMGGQGGNVTFLEAAAEPAAVAAAVLQLRPAGSHCRTLCF